MTSCSWALRGDQRGGAVVEVELRADIALAPAKSCARRRAASARCRLREFDRLAVDLHVGDQIVVAGPGVGELGAGLRQRQPERHRIDLEQHVAGRDLLALLDRDLMILPEMSGVISTFCAPT